MLNIFKQFNKKQLTQLASYSMSATGKGKGGAKPAAEKPAAEKPAGGDKKAADKPKKK